MQGLWKHKKPPEAGVVDKTSSNFSAHGKIGNFIIIITTQWVVSTCRIPVVGKWRYQCCTLDTWSRIQTLLSDNWMSRCHWTPTVTTWYSAILFVCLLWRTACHTELQTTTPAELVWRRTVASWSFPANIINVRVHGLLTATIPIWQSLTSNHVVGEKNH